MERPGSLYRNLSLMQLDGGNGAILESGPAKA
jgi:hypothetical protein